MSFGAVTALISTLAGMAASAGKAIKNKNESDVEKGQPQEFDTFDALGITSEACNALTAMGTRIGAFKNKRL